MNPQQCARFRPTVNQLEGRDTPAATVLSTASVVSPATLGFFASGAVAGGTPLVEVDRPDGSILTRFEAFETSFRGGVRVAVGEFDGNPSTVEVVATAGPGGGPVVKVFAVDTTTGAVSTIAEFLAYEPSFRDGVRVAVGRVTGVLNQDQIILGTDAGGGPRVREFNVVNGTAIPVTGPLGDFFAFEPGFRGGVRVSAGDVDGNPANGDELIVAAGPGAGPRVRVLRADGTVFQDFFALPPDTTSGVNVAVVNGQVIVDGRVEDVSQRNAVLNQAAFAEARALDAQAAAASLGVSRFGFGSPLTGFAGNSGITFTTPATSNVAFSSATTASGLVSTVPQGPIVGSAATAPGLFNSIGSVPATTAATMPGLFNTIGSVPFTTPNTAPLTSGVNTTATTAGTSSVAGLISGNVTTPIGSSITGGPGF
jgi:hypothetical protein